MDSIDIMSLFIHDYVQACMYFAYAPTYVLTPLNG